jgi:hypothetical protein
VFVFGVDDNDALRTCTFISSSKSSAKGFVDILLMDGAVQ